MIKRFKGNQGFTLVEMIVVIAIIAILAAVIIPTTAGFIDRARLSNDRQNAAQMTRVLQTYEIDQATLNNDVDWSTYEAHDVRTILDAFVDDPFVFETDSRDSGYFFLSSEGRIVAVKYGEVGGIELAIEPGINLFKFIQPQGVQANAMPGDTPEELFGAGRVLLNTGGDTVSEVVYMIRLYAQHSFNWTLLEQKVDQMGVLGFGANKHKANLEQLLTDFNPAHTLYVSNSEWKTTAAENTVIQKIVFSPGISNIPKYEEEIVSLDSFGVIKLPNTVRTIEKGAFTPLNQSASIAPRTPVKIELGAFAQGHSLEGARIESFHLTNLIDYSSDLIFDGTTIDFSNLPIRSSVTEYRVIKEGDMTIINIYTTEGFVGYAKNLYTVTYLLDGYVFFKAYLNLNTLLEPLVFPEDGEEEGSWAYYLDEDYIQDIEVGQSLPGHSVNIHLRWEEE